MKDLKSQCAIGQTRPPIAVNNPAMMQNMQMIKLNVFMSVYAYKKKLIINASLFIC